jgi:hypothetical protein
MKSGDYFPPILFAIVHPGDNMNRQKIDLTIRGLSIVKENEAKTDLYSILLPDSAEATFLKERTAKNLPRPLAMRMKSEPAVQSFGTAEKSLDESIDISTRNNKTSGLGRRLFHGMLPSLALSTSSLMIHSYDWPMTALSAAAIPIGLARFTFSKRSKTESASIGFSRALDWTFVTTVTGLGCEIAIRVLGHQ